MNEMEELSPQRGRPDWRWKDSVITQEKRDQGAIAPVLDLAKASELVGLPVVWAWATHFNFPRKIFTCVMRLL